MEFHCEYINAPERHPIQEETYGTIIASLEEETELKGIKDRDEECYLLGNIAMKGRKGEDDLTMDALFICRRFAVAIDFEDARNYVTGKANRPGMTPAQKLDDWQSRLLERINAWNSPKGGRTDRKLAPWSYTAGIVTFTNCPKEGPLPEDGCKSEASIVLRSKDKKFAHAFWSLTCQANENKGQKSFWEKPEEEWLFRSDEEMKAFLKQEGIQLKCWNEPGEPASPMPKEKPATQQPKEKPVTQVPVEPQVHPRRPATTPKGSGISNKKGLTRYLAFSTCALIVLLLLFLGPKACREQATTDNPTVQEMPVESSIDKGNSSSAAPEKVVSDTNTLQNFTPALIEHRQQTEEQGSPSLAPALEELEQMQATLLVAQAKLASAWMTAGDNLLQDAQKIGPVKGRGSMKAVKEVQLEMISQAIECYRNAVMAGNNAASRKQAQAQRMYETYK